MFGAIVLRDIPKESVRIDLARMDIQGGFRGFWQVPPAAWHYVSVKNAAHHVGFWCWINPHEAVVRVLDGTEFIESDPETVVQYSQLALSGAMAGALLLYPHELFGAWHGLVNHIPRENFPPTLHDEDHGAGSRIERALEGTHGGSGGAFLAEFQYAFVTWLVSLDSEAADDRAMARWRALLLGAYNAGERFIAAHATLFADLCEVLLRQFALLPDDWFHPDSFLVAQAQYLTEDLQDCGVPSLQEKGTALADYLMNRQP